MVTIFDLSAAPPSLVALVALALLGFLALALYSGVRVAVQTALLIGGLALIGAALGWLALAANAWVAANFQMAVGLLVGFVVGFGSSMAFGFVVYLLVAGGSGGTEGEGE